MRRLALWRASGLAMILSLALAGGCGGSAADAAAPRLGPPAVLAGFDLPGPGALRAASAAQVFLSGKDFNPDWPHNKMYAVHDDARYIPTYTGAARAFADAAYGVYAFDTTGFTGDPVLHLYFTTVGAQYSAWVGLPDYARNRWDWRLLDNPVEQHSQVEFSLDGRTQGGVLPVALVFLETQVWQVSRLYLGLQALPGAWPMAGHDASHTHRTTSAGPATSNLLWRFHSTGPALPPICLAAKDDGTLYVGAGNSLVAYDQWGASLWECYDVTPNTQPAIAANGMIYVGGRWPDNGLHAIQADGRRRWSYFTQQEVLSPPAIAPDGNIVFGCEDGYVYCLKPGGTVAWKTLLVPPVRCGVAIAPDGTIYVSCYGGTIEDPMNWVFKLSAAGEILLQLDVSIAAYGKLALTSDGTLCLNAAMMPLKNGQLFAYATDGTLRWSTSEQTSLFSWPTIGPDDTIYIGTLDGVNAYSPAGELLWHADAGGQVMGGVQLTPEGFLLANTKAGGVVLYDTSGQLVWSAATGAAAFWIAPAAAPGVGYAANLDGTVYAYNADGTPRWEQGAGRPVYSSPVVALDGSVYFGCDDTYLYALWPDGSMKWRFETGAGISASPTIGPDGTLYMGSKDGNIYAVSSAGLEKWRFETDNLVECSPVLDAAGNIYCGSNDRSLYSLTPQGALRWSYPTNWKVTASPALDGEGHVYFGSWDANVFCLSDAGEMLWTYLSGGPVRGAVAIDSVHVYVTVEDDTTIGRVYALDRATGAKLWSYRSGGPMRMGPTLGATGIVYAACDKSETGTGGTVYALKDKALEWAYSAPNIGLGLALDAGEVVYCGSSTGRVAALKDVDGLLNVLWSYDAPGVKFYTPAIANGRLYIGYDHGIYAFGAE
jgi:outer membrane protein assembly factor BamB